MGWRRGRRSSSIAVRGRRSGDRPGAAHQRRRVRSDARALVRRDRGGEPVAAQVAGVRVAPAEGRAIHAGASRGDARERVAGAGNGEVAVRRHRHDVGAVQDVRQRRRRSRALVDSLPRPVAASAGVAVPPRRRPRPCRRCTRCAEPGAPCARRRQRHLGASGSPDAAASANVGRLADLDEALRIEQNGEARSR